PQSYRSFQGIFGSGLLSNLGRPFPVRSPLLSKLLRLTRFKRPHDIFRIPDVVCDSCSHCWSDTQRLVNPAEVVVHIMQRNCRKWKHISTSYIERQNLTMRMQMRRFTRLTNGFSKKLANHVRVAANNLRFNSDAL